MNHRGPQRAAEEQPEDILDRIAGFTGLGSDSGDSSCNTLRFCAKTDWGSMSGNSVVLCVLCGEKSGTSMPWNFQIFRGNASGENVGAAPKAQPLLSSGLSQTPVFIGFSDTMSEVQNFHGMENVFSNRRNRTEGVAEACRSLRSSRSWREATAVHLSTDGAERLMATAS
jgi:hypothetical protein